MSATEYNRDTPLGQVEPDSAIPNPAAPVPGRLDRARLRMATGWPDLLLAGLLAAATFFVHDVGYMFSAPFWNDEAWVAISTKLPLHQLAAVSGSTPIGWSFLLRLVFVGGDERLRIVPLLFSALTVIAAYAYVRSLPWPRLTLGRIAAVLAGLAALLTPSALGRDDLKQYTADAFLTVLILWFVSRLESHWTRRRLVSLGVVVVVGFFFSAVGIFVGVASFGSIVLVAVIRRRWSQAIESAVVGGVTGLVLLLIFVIFYRPGISPGLNNYWAAYYLPVGQGFGASWRYLVTNGRQMAAFLGMGPLIFALLLVAAGVVTLFRLRRAVVAIVVPVLLVEMIVLGALKQYPLFDYRTSHFLTTALAVTAAIGVAGVVTLAARVHLALAVVVAVLAAVLFITNPHVQKSVRSHAIPPDDLRTPVAYLASHRQADDIIVVNMLSNWGFAYYWDEGTPVTKPVTTNLNGFITVFPDQPSILIATDRTTAAINDVMAQAAAAAKKVGPTARIWFVYQHVKPAELRDYRAAAAAEGLNWQQVLPSSLALLTPTA